MRLRGSGWTLAIALSFCASVGFAQDQRQEPSPIDPNAPLQPLGPDPGTGSPSANKPPIGAARGVSSPFDSQTYDPSQVTPDLNTLAGAAPLTLGSLQHNRNIFDPSVSFAQLGQTYPGLNGGGSTIAGATLVGGSLNFDRNWSEYHLAAIYNGGETFNFGYGGVAPRYQYHALTLSQEADWGRWRVLLRDDFTASPGATFTGEGTGGPGLASQFSTMLGTSLGALSQAFLPSETINTASVMRYMNSVLGEAEYALNRRSAVTLSGSYGLLDFNVPGFFNSRMAEGQAGYDYLLDPSDSIAILGSYGKITYTGTNTATTDYLGALSYGRKVTGRLAFRVAAGPEQIQSTGGLFGNFNRLFASANSTLTYERRRGGLSFSFVRGLTAGSGLFLGATSDIASASAHYQFTRVWVGSINGGYALNNSLTPVGGSTIQFDNWFVGANLGRRIGQHAQINFNYGAQNQNFPAICTVLTCGIPGLQQTVGVSVNWHLRKFGYEY